LLLLVRRLFPLLLHVALIVLAEQLTAQGQIIGHSHVVVEKLTSLDQTEPTDPNVFAFFKGVNDKANAQGILTASVDKGLPAGTYRLMSIVAAANHQPCIVPVAQRGSLDDAVYVSSLVREPWIFG
jgi:hypothetical protein